MRRDHDWGFFQWFAVGFVFLIGLISLVPLELAGVFGLLYMATRGPRWPADLGLLAGAGAVCLLVAALNVDGGLTPAPWAAAGAALAVPPTFLFWWLRCRPVAS
jgi:hypothetical protein